MTIAGETAREIARDDAFVREHARLAADRSFQFDLEPVVDPAPPAWAKSLLAFLEWLSPAFAYLFWGFVILAALLVAWLLVANLRGTPLRWPWRRAAPAEEAEWRPDAVAARILLSEAEALAAAGRYGEAARLLLRRSVEEIDERRPGFFKPSITAREIAGADAVPPAARTAFGAIARVVEASAFGSARVSAEAWDACRAAYAEFALAGAWRG